MCYDTSFLLIESQFFKFCDLTTRFEIYWMLWTEPTISWPMPQSDRVKTATAHMVRLTLESRKSMYKRGSLLFLNYQECSNTIWQPPSIFLSTLVSGNNTKLYKWSILYLIIGAFWCFLSLWCIKRLIIFLLLFHRYGGLAQNAVLSITLQSILPWLHHLNPCFPSWNDREKKKIIRKYPVFLPCGGI